LLLLSALRWPSHFCSIGVVARRLVNACGGFGELLSRTSTSGLMSAAGADGPWQWRPWPSPG
jgi:hypothetical protein